MTSLAIYDTGNPARPTFASGDISEIIGLLTGLGIRYEHIGTQALPADADGAAILKAYGAVVERESREFGYQSADVVSLSAQTPDAPALRAKYRAEHIHDEDEARFMAAGSGAFYLHLEDRVFVLETTEGDLISVPAGVKHWYDMGPRPSFTAIRFFTRPDGWVAAFTGDPLAETIPQYEGHP